MNKELLDILCCPYCHKDLELSENILYCSGCGKEYKIIEDIPFFNLSSGEDWDINLARKKWHNYYKEFQWEIEREKYNPSNLLYIYRHLFPIEKKSVFLEIGSGPSFLSFDLAQRGVKVVCVDFDLDILKIAREHFQKHQVEGIFLCADIHRLPLRDNLFDFSAGIGVIEHSSHLFNSVQEMERVTNKGGYVVAIVANKYHALYFSNVTSQFGELDRVMKRGQIKFAKDSPPMHTFTPGSLHGLLKKSGFSSAKIYGFPITIYPNMEETTLAKNSEYMKENLTQKNITRKLLEIESKVCLEEETASRGNMLLAIGRK